MFNVEDFASFLQFSRLQFDVIDLTFDFLRWIVFVAYNWIRTEFTHVLKMRWNQSFLRWSVYLFSTIGLELDLHT